MSRPLPLASSFGPFASTRGLRMRAPEALIALLCTLATLAVSPAVAQAHGPTIPIATDYLARIGQLPAGLQAKVLDGDLTMWMRAPAQLTVVVLDYRGAPYLRFSRAGVQVNRNSDMYYLNATPLPQTPPAGLTSSTAASWQRVSAAHAYSWHDSRLGALAEIALAHDTSYVGRWSIALEVDGVRTALAGGVWHAGAPSIVWFWFVFVLVACALAAWRVRNDALDERLTRVLAICALIAFALGGAAQDLHGRPTLSVVQLGELVVILAFTAWGLARVLFGHPGFFTYLAFAFLALWEGLVLVPALSHGFPLLALPAPIVRAAAVLCLGAGAALLPLVFRLAGRTSIRAQRRGVRTAAAPPRRERSVQS
jgi:hypothetical protein